MYRTTSTCTRNDTKISNNGTFSHIPKQNASRSTVRVHNTHIPKPIKQISLGLPVPVVVLLFLLLLCCCCHPNIITPIHGFSLEGKRAFVTGSSGGIGASIAKQLASKGARVLLHYNTRHDGAKATQKSILENGGICDGIIQCDFRKPDNIKRMMQQIDEEFWPYSYDDDDDDKNDNDNRSSNNATTSTGNEGIDILVNNAGLITKLAAEDEDEHFTSFMDTIQVNLNAPYQLSTLAYQKMKQKKSGGVIINVSSIHGSIGVEWMTAYATSKAGLDRMTANLAVEFAKDNVRVNAIAPGIVPVERTEAILAQQSSQDIWLPHLPVGRMGTVQECAHAVIYLCENEWTTGTILTLDGGMTARSNMPFRPKPIPAPIPAANK